MLPHSCVAGALLVLLPLQAAVAADTLYVVTNKSEANTVVGFRALDGGEIVAIGEFASGGRGTGDLEVPALERDPNHPLANGDDPLISANAIAASADGRWVVSVNPGDASLALMSRSPDGALTLVNTVAATDAFPLSVAVSGDWVVAASVGGSNQSGSVGLYTMADGKLRFVEGSRRDLGARPSTIDFSSDGRFVIVNELVTGKIHAFGLVDGSLSLTPVSTLDSPRGQDDRFQAIPVGFAVASQDDGDLVLMSEARFLTPDFSLREEAGVVPQSPLYSWQTSSVSSYRLDVEGRLSRASQDVLTGAEVEGGEIANCWVAFDADRGWLFTANALSSSISRFRVDAEGGLVLEDATAFKEPDEQIFLSDMALNSAGDALYQLVGNRGEVLVFDVADDGALRLRETLGGLPVLGAYGMLVVSDD
ncbi:lactonase family protein [Halomonas sp. V046]|uniref:lactonase family protein n=1 Tax=Halomonas sp. V046 TaxID=3459611 RepID=UPI004043BCAF